MNSRESLTEQADPRGSHPSILAAASLALAALACSTGGESPVASAAAAICGNGIAEAPEECDDGNASNADACLATCQRPVTWVTSDPHVHTTGCSQDVSPARLAEELKKQQIQVGAALVWGEGYATDAPLFTGRDHPLSSAGFILHYDMEVSHFQAARGGHLLLLGLDSIAFSSDVFHAPNSGIPVVEWAHRQPRAVVGMAHAQFWPVEGIQDRPGGCCTPWDAIVHAVRGRLDFLSMERMPDDDPTSFRLWKAIENAGFRVPITGGSDWSCIADRFHERTPRTDVIIEGPLTYESWLAGIKAGRTVASARVGTRLNLRVDGRRIGDELQLASAQDVTVTLETAGVAAEVEVLVNGEPRARVSVPEGLQLAQVALPVARSSWIAARSHNALTSPVYVLVGGAPVRASAEDACYLWRSVEKIADLVRIRILNLYESEPMALAAYREAASELQRRFVESGGGVCR
jgi:cysteine-rich repeat protein